jgi:hypothetical protein
MNDIGSRISQLTARGYCCSQILIFLALEAQGRENPELVRAAAGLCLGVAGSGETCGIFTGAACLLALYGAKGSDIEKVDDKLPLMFAELSEWFEQSVCGQYGGGSCRDIIGEETQRPSPDRCGHLLLDAWHRVLGILMENSFDPTVPPSHEKYS